MYKPWRSEKGVLHLFFPFVNRLHNVMAKDERKAGEKMTGAGGTPRLGRETNNYKGAELQEGWGNAFI